MQLDIKNLLYYQVQKLTTPTKWFRFVEMKSKLPPPLSNEILNQLSKDLAEIYAIRELIPLVAA